MVKRFTEAQIYNLVKIYSEYDCLWDGTNPYYKNRMTRDNAYKEILERLNIPGLKLRDIPQKIKNVRTSYYQELRRIDSSVKDGKAQYTPTVAWFSIADEIIRKIPNVQERLEAGLEPVTNDKTIKKGNTQKTLANLNKMTKNINPQSTPMPQYEPQDKNNDDEYDSFGKYIASSLRSMSKEMSIIAKMELQKTMADMQLRELRQRNENVQPEQCGDCGPSTSRDCEDPLEDPLKEFLTEPDYTDSDFIKIEIDD